MALAWTNRAPRVVQSIFVCQQHDKSPPRRVLLLFPATVPRRSSLPAVVLSLPLQSAMLASPLQQLAHRLQAYSYSVQEYENPQWQQEALQRIPAETLQERAAKASQSRTQTAAAGTLTSSERRSEPLTEALFPSVLQWLSTAATPASGCLFAMSCSSSCCTGQHGRAD